MSSIRKYDESPISQVPLVEQHAPRFSQPFPAQLRGQEICLAELMRRVRQVPPPGSRNQPVPSAIPAYLLEGITKNVFP